LKLYLDLINEFLDLKSWWRIYNGTAVEEMITPEIIWRATREGEGQIYHFHGYFVCSNFNEHICFHWSEMSALRRIGRTRRKNCHADQD
jgi:hypothetical protein